jgi:hypothetical protein
MLPKVHLSHMLVIMTYDYSPLLMIVNIFIFKLTYRLTLKLLTGFKPERERAAIVCMIIKNPRSSTGGPISLSITD